MRIGVLRDVKLNALYEAGLKFLMSLPRHTLQAEFTRAQGVRSFKILKRIIEGEHMLNMLHSIDIAAAQSDLKRLTAHQLMRILTQGSGCLSKSSSAHDTHHGFLLSATNVLHEKLFVSFLDNNEDDSSWAKISPEERRSCVREIVTTIGIIQTLENGDTPHNFNNTLWRIHKPKAKKNLGSSNFASVGPNRREKWVENSSNERQANSPGMKTTEFLYLLHPDLFLQSNCSLTSKLYFTQEASWNPWTQNENNKTEINILCLDSTVPKDEHSFRRGRSFSRQNSDASQVGWGSCIEELKSAIDARENKLAPQLKALLHKDGTIKKDRQEDHQHKEDHRPVKKLLCKPLTKVLEVPTPPLESPEASLPDEFSGEGDETHHIVNDRVRSVRRNVTKIGGMRNVRSRTVSSSASSPVASSSTPVPEEPVVSGESVNQSLPCESLISVPNRSNVQAGRRNSTFLRDTESSVSKKRLKPQNPISGKKAGLSKEKPPTPQKEKKDDFTKIGQTSNATSEINKVFPRRSKTTNHKEHPTLQTSHPALQTSHPTLQTSHPTLQTSHPTLQTSHPTLQTFAKKNQHEDFQRENQKPLASFKRTPEFQMTDAPNKRFDMTVDVHVTKKTEVPRRRAASALGSRVAEMRQKFGG